MAVYPIVAMAVSALARPANPVRRQLYISNESTNQSIAVAFGMDAALNTAGSFTVASGENILWKAAIGDVEAKIMDIETADLHIVASADNTQVTIQEF